MIIPELLSLITPKADNKYFSMKGNSGEPPKKTLHKEFVPDPPQRSNYEKPLHLVCENPF
jgi:hypothetical protein